MSIANLTQHVATNEQIVAGVVNLHEISNEVRDLLTFEEIPSVCVIMERAKKLATLVKTSGYDKAMIGGAPFLMSALEGALKEVGIQPLYAFSRRESIETVMDDGSVQKTNVFRHVGFVEI